MKRAIGLIIITIFCVMGFLSVWGNVPFMPVFGSSMEPGLQSGSLISIKSVETPNINKGDVVVYNVPDQLRDKHNYPPIIAHRVIEINEDQSGLWLKTKGDNADSDPFLIRAQNIRGTVGNQVPYLGVPWLVFQSGPGAMFIVIAVILLALLLYSRELSLGMGRLFRTFLSPIVDENHRVNLVMSRRFESTEKALDSFAGAMQQYAQHMASHTSAIQGLSDASQSLKGSAAEQNRILGHLTNAFRQDKAEKEVSRVERVVREFEKKTIQALQAKDELENRIPGQVIKPREEFLLREILQSPPGCAASPKALLSKPHY